MTTHQSKIEQLLKQYCPNGVEFRELGEVVKFLPKSKRQSGDGNDTGFYNFYVSSQTKIKKLNQADYNEEALILGTGGQASIHIASNFSTSADTFVFKSKDASILSNKYLYYFLKASLDFIEAGFKGGGLKHLSKFYLISLKIPIPPLQVQEEIVRILDTFDALVNDISIGLPTELKARKKQYEYYRNKLLTFNEYAQ